MNPTIVAAALVSVCLSTALGQGSKADYERAAGIGRVNQQRAAANPEIITVRPNWVEGQNKFWYKRDIAGRSEWFVVDAEAGTRTPLFDMPKLAEVAGKASPGVVDERGVQIQSANLRPDGRVALTFRKDPSVWMWNAADASLAKAAGDDTGELGGDLALSPRPARTVTNGESTRLTFVNKRGDEVELFWVPGEGDRRSYGKVKPGESREMHTYAGHVWAVVGADGKDIGFIAGQEMPATVDVSQVKDAPQRRRTRERGDERPRVNFISPDGKWTPVASPGELVYADKDGRKVRVAQSTTEEGTLSSVNWSPDSTHMSAIRTQVLTDRKVTYIQSSPNDQLQPKIKSYDYPKPGDPIPMKRVCLFDVPGEREIPVAGDLFPNPWSLSAPHWTPDGSRFMFVYNQRGHTVMRVLSVDAATGAVTPIVNEECKTFFDYAAKLYINYIDKTDELLWMSERDGWNHLYLIDSKTGAVKNQITKGRWVVRGVDRVDEEKREVWFRACGLRPGEDPYNVHFARVNFDGSGLTILTEGDGTHRVDYSPDGASFIDTYSRVDMPPVTALRRTSDGKLIVPIEAAPAYPTGAWAGTPRVERFSAKGRDGTTDIWGIIIRPSNFDPAKKYPVVENIYAGPHDAHVPKTYRADWGYEGQLAELGFIVVRIDGMGTNWRSKAFHDVAWKNLKDAGFPDRIAWMKTAAAKHPEMDLENHGRGVGIYGGSAGGQNAMAALLWHGDFYKAAAADCGCHDNRMGKIWWNELWMSWPVGKEYEESSNVVNAHLLPKDCKLQLWVGENDENVDPASTMQVVHALIKADKDFDLIVVPGSGHGSAESPYGRRRRMDFFVRSLMGKEPRWE